MVQVMTGIGELEARVGSHLGYSEWHEIDQERIDAFARATGDFQWIHVDPERAASGPFGTTIAHGYLTLALLPMLTWEVYDVQGVAMSVNYGANKVRFPAPVPVGSRVRAGIELVAVTSTPAGHQVETRVTVEADGVDKPVCVVECLTLVVA